MGWTKEVYELPEHHGWIVTPGYRLLVLDRGAVLLEFPAEWTVEPGASETRLRDRLTPDDSTCVLAVSCLRLPALDWSGLTLPKLLRDVGEGEQRDCIAVGPIHEIARDSLSLAWTELRVVDPGEHRECRSRTALAREHQLQCLITFDFWPEDEPRLGPVWDVVLRSLRLGVRVEDPTRGRRIA